MKTTRNQERENKRAEKEQELKRIELKYAKLQEEACEDYR